MSDMPNGEYARLGDILEKYAAVDTIRFPRDVSQETLVLVEESNVSAMPGFFSVTGFTTGFGGSRKFSHRGQIYTGEIKVRVVPEYKISGGVSVLANANQTRKDGRRLKVNIGAGQASLQFY